MLSRWSMMTWNGKLQKADSALYGTRLLITTTEMDAGYIPQINTRNLSVKNLNYYGRTTFPRLCLFRLYKNGRWDCYSIHTGGQPAIYPFLIHELLSMRSRMLQSFRVSIRHSFRKLSSHKSVLCICRQWSNDCWHKRLSHRDEFELTQHQQSFMALIPGISLPDK